MNFNLNGLNNLGNIGNIANNNVRKKSGGLFGGIIIGIILLIAGTILLWWNEGNNVKNIQTVKEATESVINVSSNTVDSVNDGKLICTNGDLQIVGGSLTDSTFSVNANTAKLKRIVEVYQWDEEEHSSNNRKTYTYTKKWSSEKIDSSKFHESGYTNSTNIPYNTQSFYANDVYIGEYKLSQDQIRNLETDCSLMLNQELNLPQGYRIYGNYITNTSDIDNPNIGDIRITYVYNGYEKASVMAVQQGNSFVDYVSSNGKTINRVEEGLLNSNQIADKITEENNMLKWGLRLLGAILIIVGYLALVSPISKISSFVPILGNLVGTVVGLISVVIGIVHSFVVISIAWIRFRPVLGISLIVAAIGLIIFIIGFVRRKKKQTA